MMDCLDSSTPPFNVLYSCGITECLCNNMHVQKHSCHVWVFGVYFKKKFSVFSVYQRLLINDCEVSYYCRRDFLPRYSISVAHRNASNLPSPTHNLQSVCVDEDHGELDDLVDKVSRVVLFACGLEVHHTDVVVIRVVRADRRRLLQLLLLIVVLETLLQHVLHTSTKPTQISTRV